MIASTPTPPYYAVIFSTQLSNDNEGYQNMASRMEALVAEQPGFLGFETARKENGITVSYWRDLESIKLWKENAEHQAARQLGRDRWYKSFKLRIAKIEHDYSFSKD